MTVSGFQEEEHAAGRFSLGVWRRILGFLRPCRRHAIALVSVSVLFAGLDAGFPLVTRWVVDDVTARGRGASFALWATVYVGIISGFAACVWVFITLAGVISTRLSHDVRQAAFDRLQELSFSFYDKKPVGWLVARLTSDCDRLSRTIAWSMLDLVWGSCLMLAISAIMLVLNWRLGLLVLGVVPASICVSLFFQKRLLRWSRAVRKTNSNITAAYNEGIAAVRTTKSLAREGENLREFQGITEQMYVSSVHSALWSAMYLPILLTLGSAGVGVALWKGGVDVMGGTMSVGTLIAFVSYAGFFYGPIMELARVFAELQPAQASAERIIDLLDTEPEIRDSAEVQAAIAANRDRPRPPDVAVDGMDRRIETIEFRDVTFQYKEGKPIVESFHLTVRAGQTIALVGPTGGGKSTIVSLLCRFYEPTAGEVRVNGIDYRRRSLHWWQSNLGIVLQTPHLFSGTVAENVRYGRPDASDEEVQAAASMVRAHEFIRAMEEGYDSQVGEGGGRLSTGQKQLVSLARAILADPQVFVMDEATSSVDTETEHRIQSAVEAVLKDRTSFVIAHRLSTIRSADRILLVRGGRIVEDGNHRSLLRRRGEYHKLYTNQLVREKEEDLFEHAAE